MKKNSRIIGEIRFITGKIAYLKDGVSFVNEGYMQGDKVTYYPVYGVKGVYAYDVRRAKK